MKTFNDLPVEWKKRLNTLIKGIPSNAPLEQVDNALARYTFFRIGRLPLEERKKITRTVYNEFTEFLRENKVFFNKSKK